MVNFIFTIQKLDGEFADLTLEKFKLSKISQHQGTAPSWLLYSLLLPLSYHTLELRKQSVKL